MTFAAAALASTSLVPPDAGYLPPDNFIVLLPLALLSFQSGGQIFLSRVLGYSEVTSVVLTSAYCDLVIDEGFLTSSIKSNSKRNRRVGSAVTMFCGAIAGGFLTLDGNINTSLLIAGSIKTVFVAIWLFWKSEGNINLE